MSSSRSDGVTHFVCSSVHLFVPKEFFVVIRHFLVLLVSLEFVVHLKCQQGASRCLNNSRMFQGNFKGVSWKFLWCFKEVSRVFHGEFYDQDIHIMSSTI